MGYQSVEVIDSAALGFLQINKYRASGLHCGGMRFVEAKAFEALGAELFAEPFMAGVKGKIPSGPASL